MHVYVLGVVKRNPLFLHEIQWKNNGFLFTIPNILYMFIYRMFQITRTILLFSQNKVQS